jgi:uridine kinase
VINNVDPRRYVIAIGGASGAGKTTLVNRVASLLGDATTLFFDNYATVSTYPADMSAWVLSGADPNAWQTPQLAADLLALRGGQSIVSPSGGTPRESAKYIVVEEPFGRERQAMRGAIDLVAIIDVPLEVALARRIRRNLHSAVAQNSGSEYLRELDQYLAAYLEGQVRELYQVVTSRALQSCDVILDGLKPIEVLAEQIVAAVRSREK